MPSPQYVQTEAGGGHAWSVSPQAASEYLRARMPYPPYIIDCILAYHQHASQTPARWDAVLDLGCGPGQLGLILSARFKHVYGRDISNDMLAIAKTLPDMDATDLEDVGLSKPPPGRTFDYALGREDALNMPDNSVDMIVIGAAAHWFDWSSEESTQRIWREWMRVLRSNGSVIVTGNIPALGNWTGADSHRTRPLRRLVRNLAHESELAKYYSQTQAELGTSSMYSTLAMPWDHCADETARNKWDRSARLYLLFDTPDDVGMDGRPMPKSDEVPQWMPDNVRSCVTTVKGPGRGYEHMAARWKTTTPRRMAVWLRSASGYVHHLRDNPEERLLVGRDEDLAARLVKQACEEGGLTYDETIEMHQAGCVLALRRTPS